MIFMGIPKTTNNWDYSLKKLQKDWEEYKQRAATLDKKERKMKENYRKKIKRGRLERERRLSFILKELQGGVRILQEINEEETKHKDTE